MRKLFLLLFFTLWSGIAVAGVYWLPDYLKDNLDNNHRTNPDNGGGDIPLSCEKYSPQCSSPHILGDKKVRVAGDLFCPMECVCPAEYKYNSANCSGDKKLAGSSCDGKYNDCVAQSCAEKGLKDCNGSCIAITACCTDSDCGNDKKCSSGNCIAQTCEDKGLKECNGSCIAITTCCTDKDCGNDKKCSSGSCIDQTCEDKGQKTCKGKCIDSTACCVSDDCPSDKKCFANVCIAQTCEDKGLKDCNGSCIAATACCTDKDCTKNRYECVENVCVPVAGEECWIGDIYSEDRKCSVDVRQGVYPLGMVVDPTQRLLIGSPGFAFLPNMSMLPTSSPRYNYNIETIPNVDSSASQRSYNGIEYTFDLLQFNSQPAAFCFGMENFGGAIIDRWYIPSAGEVMFYIKNQKAIEEALKQKTTAFRPLVAGPTEKIWLSDEAYDWQSYQNGNHHTHMNIITQTPEGSLRFGTLEKGGTASVRCFARYPDPKKTDTPIPCPYTSNSECMMYDVTGTPVLYSCSPDACPDKFFKESYYFNSNCNFCSFNMESYMASGLSCPALSTVYLERGTFSDYYFCTMNLNTSKHPKAQILGRITSRGHVLHYGPEVSSIAEAENYCLNQAQGPYLNSWRFVSTGDADPSQWKNATYAIFARYGYEGNFYVRLNPATHMWEPVSEIERVGGQAICTYNYTNVITYEP